MRPACLLAILAALAGCGVDGAPVAPGRATPEAEGATLDADTDVGPGLAMEDPADALLQ